MGLLRLKKIRDARHLALRVFKRRERGQLARRACNIELAWTILPDMAHLRRPVKLRGKPAIFLGW